MSDLKKVLVDSIDSDLDDAENETDINQRNGLVKVALVKTKILNEVEKNELERKSLIYKKKSDKDRIAFENRKLDIEEDKLRFEKRKQNTEEDRLEFEKRKEENELKLRKKQLIVDIFVKGVVPLTSIVIGGLSLWKLVKMEYADHAIEPKRGKDFIKMIFR